MENNNKWGILIIAGLLLGLFFLSKKSNPAQAYYEPTWEPQPLPPEPVKFRPIAAPPAAASEGHRYRNSETWDIEWNPDGLPSKVTIHRDAVQT